MIVFSAINKVSGEVFVGSTRENLETEWAQLISQADDGAEGRFFDLLRRHGGDGFTVEDWGYADTPAELRELTREARQELGADAIKSARAKPGVGLSRGKQSLSMEAIMASIEEAAQEVDEELQKLARQELQRQQPATGPRSAVTAAAAGAGVTRRAEASVLEPRPQELPAAGTTGSASREKRIREAIAAQREEREQLRHTGTREGQMEMNAIIARIEQRRQSGRKSAVKKPAVKKAAGSSAAVTAKASLAASSSVSSTASSPASGSASATKASPATKLPATNKLPEGRTGSSVREKRIREAIAEEKAKRDALRQAQARAEADEMAAILARLDERSKSADKLKRRR